MGEACELSEPNVRLLEGTFRHLSEFAFGFTDPVGVGKFLDQVSCNDSQLVFEKAKIRRAWTQVAEHENITSPSNRIEEEHDLDAAVPTDV